MRSVRNLSTSLRAIACLALVSPVLTAIAPTYVAASEPAAAGATRWSMVSGGGLGSGPWGLSRSCGIDTDGTLSCWGALGGIRDDPHIQRITPHYVDSATDWSTVASGTGFACATKADATLWCWGTNGSGELGDGTGKYHAAPTQVGTAHWRQVSATHRNTCGTQLDGTLWCWGTNESGQIGNGGDPWRTYLSPTQVGSGSDWVLASVSGGDDGYAHACATRTDGTLWCWGANSHGELGTGSHTSADTPQEVGAAHDWASVSTSSTTTCALRTDRSAWCWGDNHDGALGDGTREDRSTPTRVGAGADWSEISAAYQGTCGLRVDGTAWCWGANDSGQVGDGTHVRRLTPTRVAGDDHWGSISAAAGHTCALTDASIAKCWGANGDGQLGDGTLTSSTTPSPVQRPERSWSVRWTSGVGNCGITKATEVECLYLDDALYAQPISTERGWTLVDDGISRYNVFACATRSDATLWCAGANHYGVLGQGHPGKPLKHFVQVGSETWKSVAAGAGFACGVQTDGSFGAGVTMTADSSASGTRPIECRQSG